VRRGGNLAGLALLLGTQGGEIATSGGGLLEVGRGAVKKGASRAKKSKEKGSQSSPERNFIMTLKGGGGGTKGRNLTMSGEGKRPQCIESGHKKDGREKRTQSKRGLPGKRNSKKKKKKTEGINR